MRALHELIPKEKMQTPSRGVDEKTIFYLFQKIVQEQYGERGKQAVTFVSYRDKILGVKTQNPLWANELWLMRTRLIEELNDKLGDVAVKEIKLLH